MRSPAGCILTALLCLVVKPSMASQSLRFPANESLCLAKTREGEELPCVHPFRWEGNTFHQGCAFVFSSGKAVCQVSDNRFGTCNEYCSPHCPKQMGFWACRGTCHHRLAACGLDCLAKDEYPNCKGECTSMLFLDPSERQKQNWSCPDAFTGQSLCQPVSQSCQGRCPFPLELDCQTGKCYDKIVEESTSYLCDGQCWSKALPCQGECHVEKGRVSSSYFKCPNHEKCISKTRVCNRFEANNTNMCPDLAEYGRAICEDPNGFQHSICSDDSDVQCTGTRQAQCVLTPEKALLTLDAAAVGLLNSVSS